MATKKKIAKKVTKANKGKKEDVKKMGKGKEMKGKNC